MLHKILLSCSDPGLGLTHVKSPKSQYDNSAYISYYKLRNIDKKRAKQIFRVEWKTASNHKKFLDHNRKDLHFTIHSLTFLQAIQKLFILHS